MYRSRPSPRPNPLRRKSDERHLRNDRAGHGGKPGPGPRHRGGAQRGRRGRDRRRPRRQPSRRAARSARWLDNARQRRRHRSRRGRPLIDAHRPGILVLNAGASPLARPLQHQTWQTFSRNWEVDVQHVFHWTREALLVPLNPGSVVIAMSSGAALRGSPLSGGYAGAKATVRFIASYAADESARAGLGIRFIAVLPQLTPTTDLGAAAVAAYASRAGLELARTSGSSSPCSRRSKPGAACWNWSPVKPGPWHLPAHRPWPDPGNGLMEPDAGPGAGRATAGPPRVCSAGSAPSAPVSMRASWGTACHQAARAMISKTRWAGSRSSSRRPSRWAAAKAWTLRW